MDRMQVAELNQEATRVYLRQWYRVARYGQELLSDEARLMLRSTRSLDRWLADFLVSLPGDQPFLADAKYSWPTSLNHSVEMRSLLAAAREDMATWYVFSTWNGSTFSEFRALKATDIPHSWPCCSDCGLRFTSSLDTKTANITVPDYCPNTPRTRKSSSTPYFVVRADILSDTRPTHRCRICGGTVLSSSNDPRAHTACLRWPDAGTVYGPEWNQHVHMTAHGAPTDEPPAPAPFDADMDAAVQPPLWDASA